jgi:ribosomal protein L20A (L18A)
MLLLSGTGEVSQNHFTKNSILNQLQARSKLVYYHGSSHQIRRRRQSEEDVKEEEEGKVKRTCIKSYHIEQLKHRALKIYNSAISLSLWVLLIFNRLKARGT